MSYVYCFVRRCAPCVAVALLSLTATTASGGGPTGTDALKAPGGSATGTLKASGWWAAAQKHITELEYQISWQEPQQALHAANRASNLRVYFRETGVEVMPRTGEADWRLTFTLTHFGRAGLLKPAASVGPTADGRCVEYQRENISEWYANHHEGIEQGYIIEKAPEGEGTLLIQGRFSGNIDARLTEDGRYVSFSQKGREILRYDKLLVEDATGRQLASHLTLDGNTLGIVIEEEGTYPILVDPILATPWSVESNQAGASLGWSVSGAGDVNNDGYSDVIAGAPFYDNGENNEGRAFVYHGSASGLSTTPDWTAESDQADSHLGLAVGTAGDVNGDGFSDVIVGAPNHTIFVSTEGLALVWYGSASGLGANGTRLNADWWARGNDIASGCGGTVGSAGDVNGDGYSDVIFGARNFNNGENNEGLAFVFHGSATGLGANTTIVSADWWAQGNQDQAAFGVSAAGAGDVNGDGYSDVIVGADAYDNGEINEGAAFVWYGSATGLGAIGNPLNADWTGQSNQANAFFGTSVASAGDVNNDGYSDIIVGAISYTNGESNEGAAFVWHGSGTGLFPFGTPLNADWTVEGNQIDATLGRSVASAGDVGGDGFSDVVVGANRYDNGETDEGLCQVFLGGSTGLANLPTFSAEGNVAFAWLGWSVAGAGDVNGDGFSDVIVGIRDWSNPELGEGRVVVYHGGSDIVPVTLQGYRSRWAGAHVEVEWTLFDAAAPTFADVNFTVHRKVGSAGNYAQMFEPEIIRSDNRFVLYDRAARPQETYSYRVAIFEAGEAVASFETVITTPSVGFALFQNHPNPFNPLTRIDFTVGRTARFSLRIYDASGKLVTTLFDRALTSGPYSEVWDGRDARGRNVASGTYFIKLEGGRNTLTRKAVLLR